MVKHNNEVPHQHFRKDWDQWVKVWTDQAGRKKRRRIARQQKALAVYPRPVAGLLRPVVRGQTVRYNRKLKVGRGFSLQELKEAKVSKKHAQGLGIAVDHRRINESQDGLRVNVQRLKEYLQKRVEFKKGEKPTVSQYKGRVVMPFKTYPQAAVETRAITDADRKVSAFETLRNKYAMARFVGKKSKGEEEEAAKK